MVWCGALHSFCSFATRYCCNISLMCKCVLVFEAALGYSTERCEKHIADDPRTVTLNLRHQQRAGTGSVGDLDRALHDDPDVVSSCSS